MKAERPSRVLPILLFAGMALAAIAPIRNYDLFWHLATGRWIVEHGALPLVDPFAVASDRREWINGEWLFEVAAHELHEQVGLRGLSIARAGLAALIFTLAFFFGGRSALLATVAFAGSMQTFDFRPSSAALLFVVLAIALGERHEDSSRRGLVVLVHFVLAAVWINVHPSALLAPGIALLATRSVGPVVASAVGLFVSPHGWRAIFAPLELMSFVRSGAFVNAEWLPSGIDRFPLLYVLIAGGAIVLIASRAAWWRILLFAAFAWLAAQHVRNQGVFFAAFALLVAPSMPRIRASIAATGAACALVLVAATTDHRLGVPPERFPATAVARLRATGLSGNIYNPDQFGGYLIWSFYPERRALTDGRNELYRAYIPEYAHARGNQRAWRALLEKYRIDLAVDEYRPPLQVVDAVTRQQRAMPASLAYWPRRDWALIGFDEAGMVFARRAAFPPERLQHWEIRGIVPDARK